MMRQFLILCVLGTCLGLMQVSCSSGDEITRLESPAQPSSALQLEQAEQPVLSLHAVSHPLVLHDLSEFSLDLFVENLSQRPVTIFPSFIQMEFRPLERGTVSFRPMEQEPVSIWEDAFVLMPEEVRTINDISLKGRQGTWSLERGSYGLSIRYYVENDQLPLDRSVGVKSPFKESHLWVGDLQSQEVTIHYVPKGTKSLPLSMNR